MDRLSKIVKETRAILRSRTCQQVNTDSGRYYAWNSIQMTSVTNYVSGFFPFSPKKAIESMKTSGSFDIKYPGKTADEVMVEWSQLGQKAAREGTEMHKMLEDYLKDSREPEKDSNYLHEFNLAKKFIKDKKLVYIDGEVSIFDEDLGLAGTPDAIFVDPEMKFYLIDWKRSLKVGINLDKHKLQTLTYANILSNKYNIKIEKCIVVGLHVSMKTYEAYEFNSFLKFDFMIGDELRHVSLPANKTIADLVLALDLHIPVCCERYVFNRFLYRGFFQTDIPTNKITSEYIENNQGVWRQILGSGKLLEEVIKKLKLDINKVGTDGLSLVHVFIRHNFRNSLDSLLEMGADIHKRCPNGNSLYKNCLMKEDKRLFDVLINRNLVKIDGLYNNETPLTFAITHSLKEIFQHILLRGANPNKKNARGASPLQLSMKKTDRFFTKKMRKYILLHRRKPNNDQLSPE